MGMDVTCCSSEAGWGPGRGGPAPCPGVSARGKETASAGRRPRPQHSSALTAPGNFQARRA